MSWKLSPIGAGENLMYSQAGTPSLDLRFASSKSLTDYVSGQNLVTFTRASSGTYVDSDGLIKTATTNEPRIDHNPTTGESLGLLVEESRLNNMLYSEDFSDASWTQKDVTVTTNTVVAPDGTLTADTFGPVVGDGLTTTRLLRQEPALTTQGPYTFSVFVKVGTATANGIGLVVGDQTNANNFRSNFKLLTGDIVVGSSNWATPTATITPYPNGWYRCAVSGVTSTAHTNLRAAIYLGLYGNTDDAYGTHHIWGAQLEAGAFPTSYIPTTAATVTRSADLASITGTNFSSWYRQDEGSFFASYAPSGVNPSTAGQAVFAASDDTATDRVYLAKRANVDQSIRWASNKTGAANTAFINLGTWQAQPYAFAGCYKENDFAASLDGAAVATDNTVELFTGCSLLTIGADRSAGQSPLNGTIRRLTFWPQRLSNSTLQAITQ